jgi:hypothetical protein
VDGECHHVLQSAFMDAARQKLIERARELNTSTLPVDEVQDRIHEVCSEYLIEAKVDVDRLLKHDDWRVRQSALDIVSWGVGATDGIETSIEIPLATLMRTYVLSRRLHCTKLREALQRRFRLGKHSRELPMPTNPTTSVSRR